MKMTTSHLTKKRLTALAAICCSGFLLAACEPSAEQTTSEQTETGATEQEGAPTYGQRDRDATLQEDPAMESPATTPDTSADPMADPSGGTSPGTSPGATDTSTDAEADTAF